MNKMVSSNLMRLSLWMIFILGMGFVSSQSFYPALPLTDRESTVIWCTVNSEEQRKCEALSETLKRSPLSDDFGRTAEIHKLNCTQSFNKDECMIMLDNNVVDLTTLDPGEVFVGGREHSLVPIMSEQYNEGLYGVAVIPKSLNIRTLHDLRGKKACFGGVGTLAGWVIPMDKLIKHGGMEIVDCNNHVKSALSFFGPSCAVNSLSDKYNPLGDNSHKLCEICGSELPGVRCTSNDPYIGYEGALKCLMDQGEVAFLKHSAIEEYFTNLQYIGLEMARNLSEAERGGRGGGFNPFTSTTTESIFPFFRTTTTTTQPPFFLRTQPPPLFNQSGFVDTRDERFRQGPLNHPGGSQFSVPERPKGPQTLAQFKAEYELLCDDGSTSEIDNWRSCNWGILPSHVVVTSSAKPYRPTRRMYQDFIRNIEREFGGSGSGGSLQQPQQTQIQTQGQQGRRGGFHLFESIPRYGNRSNLMFQDATTGFRTIEENDQSYIKYLGQNINHTLGIRACPVEGMRLCVTSDPELVKCTRMRQALNAQLLKPELRCVKGHSTVNCIRMIASGDADTAVLDAGDVYTAGYHYGLIPVMSEIYNTLKAKLGEPEYFAVAVAYQGDADTELTYLKGKMSCHSGIGHGAGWIIPMAYLISSGRMRHYGCDSVTAASQYFSKSCVPGALSKEHTFGSQHSNLCDLCRGSSASYCRRDASEDFYGHTGAFRCLIEGGGQVAFVKHTTVNEVTDGRRRETWARNTLSGDYELLCRDGTRAPVTEYERCNLGKVKANALVVRGGEDYNHNQTQAIINLFLYSQQYYGRKDEDDFNFGMFYSPPPYSDLIFQDAAQQLKVIPENKRNYRDYLGKTFLKARALVDCRAGSKSLIPPSVTKITLFLTGSLFYIMAYSS